MTRPIVPTTIRLIRWIDRTGPWRADDNGLASGPLSTFLASCNKRIPAGFGSEHGACAKRVRAAMVQLPIDSLLQACAGSAL